MQNAYKKTSNSTRTYHNHLQEKAKRRQLTDHDKSSLASIVQNSGHCCFVYTVTSSHSSQVLLSENKSSSGSKLLLQHSSKKYRLNLLLRWCLMYSPRNVHGSLWIYDGEYHVVEHLLIYYRYSEKQRRLLG